MKLTISRDVLLKALGRVHRVVEKKNVVPILSNVVLDASEGMLRLKATDLDLEISEPVAADVEIPGSTTVPAHTLHDIVRKLAGTEVSLKMADGGNQIRVSSGRSGFNLHILPREDFPEISEGNFSHNFEIPADDLRKLVDRTKFAMSSEETRYYLNGIYFHVFDDGGRIRLRSVATDGHRLAVADVDAPQGTDGMPAVIIPRKTVGEVLRLLDGAEIVSIHLSPSKMRFDIGDASMVTKLIDATYPDYQRVIPMDNDKVLTVDRVEFSSALERVSVVSSERGRAVKMAIADGSITLTVNSPDLGHAEEDFPADYSDEALEIGLNVKYALDVLSNVTSKDTEFLFADSGSPVLVKDTSDDNVLYVVMPMRV